MWQTSGRSARFAHQIVHRAFLRTFWQTVAGTPTVAGHRSVALTASDLIAIDWAGVTLGVAAVILCGILTGGRAAAGQAGRAPTQWVEFG